MHKYQKSQEHLLTDETLKSHIKEWQQFHLEAVLHNDEQGMQMTQEHLDKMRDCLESRQQSA